MKKSSIHILEKRCLNIASHIKVDIPDLIQGSVQNLTLTIANTTEGPDHGFVIIVVEKVTLDLTSSNCMGILIGITNQNMDLLLKVSKRSGSQS
jgi:hypothetical protein